MMPTLLAGDFIIVNKYNYGLRLPVLNTKFLNIGEPERGDVVVFRYPLDPGVNYIKRLVGLPGDRVVVKDDRLYVNDQPIEFKVTGPTTTAATSTCQAGGGAPGRPRPPRHVPAPPPGRRPSAASRPATAATWWAIFCNDNNPRNLFGAEDSQVMTVPEGHYLMIGDNRDNSEARLCKWGFVPENNLVGKATRIWFNLDLQRSGGPIWGRIGSRIE